MQNPPIARIMTSAPASVAPAASVSDAERVMREHRCHHVPVVDGGGRVVGMVTAHDLLKALLLLPDADERALKQASLQSRRVAEVMRQNVTVLPQTATLLDAARALANGELHAVLVVAPGNVLAGIVTSTDLIEVLLDGLKYPAPETAGPAASGEQALSPLQLRRLREVYRATLYYLESGRGELEHGRLLTAVNRAREVLAPERMAI
jgi:CBS domain-containing protein